jgi:hypothetical protein
MNLKTQALQGKHEKQENLLSRRKKTQHRSSSAERMLRGSVDRTILQEEQAEDARLRQYYVSFRRTYNSTTAIFPLRKEQGLRLKHKTMLSQSNTSGDRSNKLTDKREELLNTPLRNILPARLIKHVPHRHKPAKHYRTRCGVPHREGSMPRHYRRKHPTYHSNLPCLCIVSV